MPKIVDHDARRDEIVQTYLAIAATKGVSGTTAKLVCQHLGVSVGSLWHYFDSFDDVVRAAARHVLKRDTDRLKTTEEQGLGALMTAAVGLLPLDEATQAEAAVLLGFWGNIPANIISRDELTNTDLFTEPLASLIRAAIGSGQLRAETPALSLAAALNQLLDGAQVSQVLCPALSREEHLARLACLLYPWAVENPEDADYEKLREWMGFH